MKSQLSSSSCTAVSVGSWITGQASLGNRVESASRCSARFSTSRPCLAAMRQQKSPARRLDPFSNALKPWALRSHSGLWCSSSRSQPVMVCPKQEQPRNNQSSNHRNNLQKNPQKPMKSGLQALQMMEQQPQENHQSRRGTTYLRYPVKALVLVTRAARLPCLSKTGPQSPRPSKPSPSPTPYRSHR